MGDPRNVAHDKKVIQEKHHKGEDVAKGAVHAPQPGKKTHLVKKKQAAVAQESSSVKTAEPAKPETKPDPTQLEKSLAVLAKLRELEFHSRGNMEKLAELSLTIEDDLKQKPFVEPIGAVYSAQDAFQSKIVALTADYEAECERLKPTG
jgi:hypothetical protein